jgi:hypothetical protein
VAEAIVGLGSKVDTTYATDAALAVETAARIAADALKATISALSITTQAGADNSSTHDYTITGVTATSTVVQVLAFKHTDGLVIAATGTITPGAGKVTIATGADLSTYFLVFFIVK